MLKKATLVTVALIGMSLCTSTVAFAGTTNSGLSTAGIQTSNAHWANFTKGSKVVYIKNPANESGVISKEESSFISTLPQKDQQMFRDFIHARANNNTESFLTTAEGQKFSKLLTSNPTYVKELVKYSDFNNRNFQINLKAKAGTTTTYVFPDGSEEFASTTTTTPQVGVDPTTTFTYGYSIEIEWWYCNLIATWTLEPGLYVDISDVTGATGSFNFGEVVPTYNGDGHTINNGSLNAAAEGTFTVSSSVSTTTEDMEIVWSEGSPTGYLISGGGGNYGSITTS